VIDVVQDASVDKKRKAEMEKQRDHYECTDKCLSTKYFQAPTSDTKDQWIENKKSLIPVNYTEVVVRTWLAILSSEITRNVEFSNDKDIEKLVRDCVAEYLFNDITSQWKENALVYGTAVNVPMLDPVTEEFTFWLPFPINTEIIKNPVNVYDTLVVVEINDGFRQFISKWGSGIIYEDGSASIVEHQYDKLPVAIGYGKSKLHQRNPYGDPVQKEAADFGIQQAKNQYNVSLLSTQQTRDILHIGGPLDKISHYADDPNVEVGLSEDGVLALPDGFTAQFLKPNPKINESIEVQKMYAATFSSISGIPIDILCPDSVTSPSAEAARIRSLPLMHKAKQLVPRWLEAEKELIQCMLYVAEAAKAEEAASLVTWKDVKSRSTITVQNHFNVLPSSPNEIMQNTIAGVAAGIIRHEDAIRTIPNNDHLTEEDIKQMVEEYKSKASANAHAIEQNALKTSKDALTDQQKSQFDNKQ